jgi:uncharacterized protein YndB with AHSA1/START domain
MKNIFYKTVVVALIGAQTSFGQSATRERILSISIEVNASVDSVWSRWTTEPGRKKFFAPSSKMELSTLGFMEILFMPSAPAGQRGAENNRVLAFKEKEMLSFTWDAPPKYPELRKQRTVVVIRLEKSGDKKTKVILSHMGWGKGTDWDEVYNYFTAAWSTFVLPNLKYSLEVAPVDWNDFPNRLPKNLPAAIVSKE